jgi:hypothetical protein
LWAHLHRAYPERVLAFEHRTLTVSPAGNAIDLLPSLPKGIELHLVSHSRGGLVGELLGRGGLREATDDRDRPPFDDTELGLFQEGSDGRVELERLNVLLLEHRPKVTLFVRVACPARGTSLLGARVDRWLNLVLNVMKLGVGGAINPVAG